MNYSQHVRRGASRPLVALMATVMAALALVLAPTTALAAGSGDYTYENGSLGFFKWIGADEAVKVIEESPDNKIVGPYQDLDNMDDLNSAFNLDNMYRALDTIEYCNQLRVNHDAPVARVDPYLMAISQVNTNFSNANYLTHSNAYANVSENIAWGFENPFSRWYYDEKGEWESEELRPAREHMEKLLAQGVRYEDARASALNYIREHYDNYSDLIYGGGGHYGILHYLNLIHPMWIYTGAASAGPGTNWWDGAEVYAIDEQTFYYTTPSDKTYTVAEFRALLDEYMDYVSGRQRFLDVKTSDWFYGNVEWAAENGIMNGYSGANAGKFGPYDTMSRSQLAGVLYNIAGNPAADLSILGSYYDVPSNQWYSSAIAWAAGSAVMGGYGNGYFDPDGKTTREQIVTVLWRMTGEPTGTGNLYAYPDGHKTSDYARDAMAWATGAGVINGNAVTGEINPTGSLTRAEAAAILMNWHNATGR